MELVAEPDVGVVFIERVVRAVASVCDLASIGAITNVRHHRRFRASDSGGEPRALPVLVFTGFDRR